jgi:amino acid adenylation domain-containing protein
MVAGLLGILAAGGCYVPLDPLLPEPRLAAILETARPAVVVAEPRLAVGVPPFEGTVLLLEGDAGAVPPPAAAVLELFPELSNAAYVLFTSGSTGRPKGVVVEHRQLSGYVAAIIERLGLPPGASFATVSTLAADLGNTAIFPALCTGGTLHVITQRQAGDAVELAAQVARRPYDALKIVPSHLSALLASSPEGRGLPRRCLVLGGEAFGWELAEKVRAAAPDLAVFNHYGPTEATVGALAGRLEERDELSATVPLGRPLANSRIYLLGPDGEPVPRGVPGEVCIGGGGVARGYLADPRQTAERFVPDPFGTAGRLYRTGDLARWLPDGRAEFLGRIDDQVKIRGFRVEPAEIAAALKAHPDVRDAAVVARTEPSGERRLVAYLVERPGRGLAIAGLRESLRQRLPEAMVPAAFVLLASLPLTPNGKLDRQALPAPAPERLAAETPYVAPRTGAEQAVSAIWQQILGLERVGLHENFFDLGGHSLHMVQVQSRVQEHFQRQVAIVDLFRHPTVRGLADFLGAAPAPGPPAGQGEERAESRKAALDHVRPGGLPVDHA